jgi:hypothetical protein
MTTPTQIVIPNADFTAAPLAWVLPASVAASYTGVLGGTLSRTLQNGSAVGAAPSSILGVTPTVSPGYASFAGFPQSGLVIPQLETLNYTFIALVRCNGPSSGAGNTSGAPILGDPGSSNNNTNIFYFALGTQISVQQKATDATSATVGLTGLTLGNWTLFIATGASGVGITAQNLTVGGSRAVTSALSAKVFAPTANSTKLGAGIASSAINFPGQVDVAAGVYFPSVLSAPDQSLMEAWMRKLALKTGITV